MISFFLNKVQTKPVNFSKPWWQPFTNQKLYCTFILIGELIVNAYKTYTPIFISTAYETRSFNKLIIIFVCWLGIIFLEYLVRQFNNILELKTMYSVQMSGHSFFLTVDPIYHSKRSSGAILSKIARATRGYEEILDRIVLDILPITITSIAAIINIMNFDFWIGLIIFLSLSVIITINILGLTKIIIPIEHDVLARDDLARTVALENLTQIHLIRSSFATESINQKYIESEKKVMFQEGLQWVNSENLYGIVKALYILTIAGLCFWLLKMINSNQTSTVVAFAILMTYMKGTASIIKIGKPIRKIAKSLIRIKDLFKFIQQFGKQSFPVLDKDYQEKVCDSPISSFIQINCDNLFFDYNQQAKIFDGHNLRLKIPIDQENKLYGITGPSGIGKSTLINIIGGQLKPTSGSININGVNIYSIDDNNRKKLIALQGQVATNMRGSLAYNLLFGIDGHAFTNEYLILVLERVGLWQIFEQTGGLDSFVGESGINLSGGQRQRLNFANLYLRAIFYRPAVVLIDEPTSSLDETSEQAVTDMILEISQHALTFVIAHRLKTLESAIAILDFSLLQKDLDLEFVPISKFKKESNYFKELINNKEELF